MNTKMKSTRGYVMGKGGVFVPSDIAEISAAVIAERAPHEPGLDSYSVPSVDQPAAAQTKTAKRLSLPRGTLQIYREEDVASMDAGLQTLSRSNDRLKNSEFLIALLRKNSPVGVRRLAKVPRRFSTMLDALDAEMPNFRNVIAAVRRMLALQVAGDGSFQLPPMLLAGDPGVGKTYFAMRLAQLMDSGFDMISMEGATSAMSLIGLEQHYASSSPGKVFDLLVQGSTANPIFVVDELDKASSQTSHPPANALYQLLETQTAKRFCDQACLQVRLDASRISWIITANDLSSIPAPILSRLTTFHVPSPSRFEREQIARTGYRDLCRSMTWGKRFDYLLPTHTAQAVARRCVSVRSMKSLLRMACANAFLRKSSVVSPSDVTQALLSNLSDVDLEHMPVCGRA